MGYSRADKANAHARIIRHASRSIREEGTARPSVAGLMQRAGLTHGGFYKHFSSREELIVESAVAALADGHEKMQRSAAKNPEDPFAGIVDDYLSERHCDDPGGGCALVTLGADAGRGGTELRAAYADTVRQYIDLLTTDGESSDRSAAASSLSTLVGAVLLARAVGDADLSAEILAAAKSGLLKAHGSPEN